MNGHRARGDEVFGLEEARPTEYQWGEEGLYSEMMGRACNAARLVFCARHAQWLAQEAEKEGRPLLATALRSGVSLLTLAMGLDAFRDVLGLSQHEMRQLLALEKLGYLPLKVTKDAEGLLALWPGPPFFYGHETRE